MSRKSPESVTTSWSVKRIILWFGAVSAGLLLACWLLLGRMLTEKIATALVLPCGVIWYVLTACLVLSAFARQKRLAASLLMVWLMYTLCGNGLLVGAACLSLEAEFQNSRPLQEEPFDYVIVLGGGGGLASNGRMQGNSSGDRLILAAQLYHAGIAPQLICTGQSIPGMDSSPTDPATVAVDVLTKLGVARSAIDTIGGQNTALEMQALKQRFADADLRLGLVTSAWHLPRALRLAQRSQLNLVPLPADFLTGPQSPMTPAQKVLACVPQAENFLNLTRVFREYLAAMVGR